MTISLKGMSRKELEKLRQRIDKEMDKLSKADLKAARAAAEKAASAYGVSLNDLVDTPTKAGKAKAKKAKTVGKAKIQESK